MRAPWVSVEGLNVSLWRRCLGLCKQGGEGLGESGNRFPFNGHGRGADEGSPDEGAGGLLYGGKGLYLSVSNVTVFL